ncbi:MAG: asparagine synthetase B [Armatimonadota bacterium]|jgi:hypothetical protein
MRRLAIAAQLTATLFAALPAAAQHLLVPMDKPQTDHLKAYGLAYWCLQEPRVYTVHWLLNYRGGAFVLPARDDVSARAEEMGVIVEAVSNGQVQAVDATIEQENMEKVVLERAPRVAVYIPPDKEPWDDAVTLALTYADIPYQKLWDTQILGGELGKYDWLHLHHEDFTGQFGKLWYPFRHAPWYIRQVRTAESAAQQAGYLTVQAHKCAVAKAIRGYVDAGGFVFAMCLAVDTLDVALAAEGIDIVPPHIDGTPVGANAQAQLDYSKTFGFRSFRLITDPMEREFSDIDVPPPAIDTASRGQTFELFEFSAKQDPILSMLTQNHTGVVPDFLGQTTAFNPATLKDSVMVMGAGPRNGPAKYIHGDYGEGTFTFYGGHDPEDYAHVVGEEPTDLSFHKHSPGYRLILNNILFPAAKRTPRKT